MYSSNSMASTASTSKTLCLNGSDSKCSSDLNTSDDAIPTLDVRTLQENDNKSGEATNEYLSLWERYKFDNKQALPKLTISLNPLRVNEILVSSPGPRVREITYTGSEDSYETTGPRRRSRTIREWRAEVINALPRKKDCDYGSRQQDDLVILKIASEYPSIFFVEGFKDDVHSILDVLTGQKMTTFVLDAFLTRRIKSQNEMEKSGSGHVQFVYIPILFLPVFDRSQEITKITPNATYFPRRSIYDSSYDCVFISPLYICTHFYLAVFYLASREIRIYDSSWNFVPIDLRLQQVRKIASYISSKYGSSCDNWNITLVERCPQQRDEYSCGCYVIYFAENEINGDNKRSERKMTTSEISKIRSEIVSDLLQTSTVGSKLLEAISL